jgi:dephospho-CoA kinase
MKVIGITGGIASGKSTVTKMIRAAGHPVVCADDLAHAAVAPGTHGLKKVLSTFGNHFALPDGSLDRRKLAEHVFGNPLARKNLETIIHPEVRKVMEHAINDERIRGAALLFLDIPLLFETNLDILCDETICVYTRQELQIERHMSRSGDSREHTLKRIQDQMALDEKLKLADHVLQNHGTIEDLRAQVTALLAQLEAP